MGSEVDVVIRKISTIRECIKVFIQNLRQGEIQSMNRLMRWAKCLYCVPIFIMTFPPNLSGTYPWPRYRAPCIPSIIGEIREPLRIPLMNKRT